MLSLNIYNNLLDSILLIYSYNLVLSGQPKKCSRSVFGAMFVCKYTQLRKYDLLRYVQNSNIANFFKLIIEI